MRLAIIIFTGMAIGITISVSSLPTQIINTTPIHETFLTPAIKSVGESIGFGSDHVMIEFNDHIVRFKITGDTKINKLSYEQFKGGEHIPIPIEDTLNKLVYITYSEIDEELVANKLIVPK